jgi:poly-gamma-glutamate synthesis protein (capsule biosynthesis protein)
MKIRLTSLLLVFCVTSAVGGTSLVQAETSAAIASMYRDPGIFEAAIAKEEPANRFRGAVTGITVPHHLLAADLIARGFWIAGSGSYDRIIVISPDHFGKSRTPFAVTRRDIESPFGLLVNDRAVTSALTESTLFSESDLFENEHGIQAELPFIKHFFPGAKIVPIVVSASSSSSDWDAAISLLARFAGDKTLIVQSTDYSHYLPLEVAVKRDQESLNIIAANDKAAVAGLIQPDHMDAKGAQYIQMGLQQAIRHGSPVVVANRNSAEYSAMGTRTTSYIVTAYLGDPEAGSRLRYNDQMVFYVGGDLFAGRWLTEPLADRSTAAAVVERIRSVTGGAPMIVNLEGVLLERPPSGIGQSLHVMHADLAISILKALNVQAVSLANNHSNDLGKAGLEESIAILNREGIKPLRHMIPSQFAGIGLVAANFIGSSDYHGYPVIHTASEIEALCRQTTAAPLIAFVHWGEEYRNTAAARQYQAADELHRCGAGLIVGAHSHMASLGIEAPRGGAYQMIYSVGNLLFDQAGSRSTTAILELRLFEQKTIAARLIPLPNLFDLAVRHLRSEDPVR